MKQQWGHRWTSLKMGAVQNCFRTRLKSRGGAAFLFALLIIGALPSVRPGIQFPLLNLSAEDIAKVAWNCVDRVKKVLDEVTQWYRANFDTNKILPDGTSQEKEKGTTHTNDTFVSSTHSLLEKLAGDENWQNTAMHVHKAFTNKKFLKKLQRDLQKPENCRLLSQLRLLQQHINTKCMKKRVHRQKVLHAGMTKATLKKVCSEDLSMPGRCKDTNDTVTTNTGVEKIDAACHNSNANVPQNNAKNGLSCKYSPSAKSGFKKLTHDDDSTLDRNSVPVHSKELESLDFKKMCEDFNINNNIFVYACMDGNDSGDKGTTNQNQNNGHSSSSNSASGHGNGNTPSCVSGSGANQGNDGNGEDPRKPSKNERIGGCSSDVGEARRKAPRNSNQPDADRLSNEDRRHEDSENSTTQLDPTPNPEEIGEEQEPRCQSPEWSPASTSRAGLRTPALPGSDHDMPHGAAGFPTTKQLLPQGPQYARHLSTSPFPSPPSSLQSPEDGVPEEHLNLNENPKEPLLDDNQVAEVPVHSHVNAKESLHPHSDQDHLHSGLLPGRRNDNADIFRDIDRDNDPRSEHPVYPQHLPPTTRAEDNRQIPPPTPPPPEAVSAKGSARSTLHRLLTYLDRSAQDDRNRDRCLVDQGYSRKGQTLQAGGRTDLVQRHDNSFFQESIPREVNLRPDQPIRASIEERRVDRTFRDPPGSSGRRSWFCHSCNSAHMISGVPAHACDECGRFFCLDHWEHHTCVQNWFLDDVDEAQAVQEDDGNGHEVEDVILEYNDENDERDDDNGQSDDCNHRRSFSG